MTPPELLALWIAWCLAGGSPGPATLAIAGTAMDRGRRAALMVSLGILAGSASWGLAAAAGLSAVMLANAWMFEALRYVGAAYLLWLAAKALRSAWLGGAATRGAAFAGGPRRLFSKGMLLHLTNPKAILSWGSIYALVAPADATPWDLFWLFGFLFSGSIIVFLGYAVLFSSAPVVRGYARAKRVFDACFAAFFGAASIKLLTARLQ